MKKHTMALMGVSLLTIVVIGLLSAQSGSNGNGSGLWQLAGSDLSNSRNQPSESTVSPANVATLTPVWTFTAGGDISATPTVDANAVYAPDWAGNLFAVSRSTGKMIWSHKIADYDGVDGALSRTSPAISGDTLILGDTESRAVHPGANIIAVDRQTGSLRWITQIDSQPAAIITGSPVVAGNVIYVGVSSIEEGLADQPGYACCTFRGSMVALNASTGKMLWKTYTVPDNHGQTNGYSGGAIWQPPAIDPVRGLLYVGTGNNYTAPDAAEDCEQQTIAGNPPAGDCMASDNYFDTAMALDLATGKIKWAMRLKGYDVWTVACTAPKSGVSCPSPAGPDYDLSGSGPNLLPNIVGFGQKSGIYWALNPDNGSIVWTAVVGPGGTLGGLEWGTATDGKRIYTAITNNAQTAHRLMPTEMTINWGFWSALDAVTGRVLWETADPTTGTTDPGAVSVANGVVYAGSYSGSMYGLDAVTGKILWSFASGGSVVDGPSIVNGMVYWGSGYQHIRPGTPNNKLYAFGLPK